MLRTSRPRASPALAPHISIALSTHNGERFLGEQLESIARQSRLPRELVVRDDHSQDSTVPLLEAFMRRARFPVRIIRGRTRMGSTPSFEVAMSACLGDITVLCDQDDVWYPSKLQRLEREFARRPEVGAVFSNAALINEAGERMPFCAWDLVSPDATGRWVLGRRRSGHALTRYSAPGCTLAYRTRMRDAILPFPEAMRVLNPPIHHDRWLLAAAAAQGPVSALEDCLVAYRLHSGQQIGFGPYVPFLGSYGLPLRVLRALRRWGDLSRLVGSMAGAIPLVRDHAVRLPEPSSGGPPSIATVALLDHGILRTSLPRALPARARLVGGMWMDGGYHAFGHGSASALSDLIRPGRM